MADIVAGIGCAAPSIVVGPGPLAERTELTELGVVYAPGGDPLFLDFVAGPDQGGDGVVEWTSWEWPAEAEGPVVKVWTGGENDPGVEPWASLVLPDRLSDSWIANTRAFLVPAPTPTIVTVTQYVVDWEGWVVRAGALEPGANDAASRTILDAADAEKVQSAGDLDGDGFGDVSASEDQTLAVFSGPFGGEAAVRAADVTAALPFALVSPPDDGPRDDLDGDGRDDVPLLLAATGGTAVAMASWQAGVLSAEVILLDVPLDLPQRGVLRTLQANGDGQADLALGGRTDDPRTDEGAVVLELGPFSERREVGTHTVVRGAVPYAAVGSELEAGDTNGDGFDDLLLTGNPAAAEGVGAWLLFGGP